MNKTNITAIATVLLLGGALYFIYRMQQKKKNEEIDNTAVSPQEAKDLIDNPQID